MPKKLPNPSDDFKRRNPDLFPGYEPEKSKPDKKKREPNQTELRFIHDFPAYAGAKFEGITLNMENGRRYKPDWMICKDGIVYLVEVKGSHKFHSHSRAQLAYDQSRVEYPFFRFAWARWTDEEWDVTGDLLTKQGE